jgi:hypothetical protein
MQTLLKLNRDIDAVFCGVGYSTDIGVVNVII